MLTLKKMQVAKFQRKMSSVTIKTLARPQAQPFLTQQMHVRAADRQHRHSTDTRVQDSHSGAHALIEEIARKSKAQRTSRILE